MIDGCHRWMLDPQSLESTHFEVAFTQDPNRRCQPLNIARPLCVWPFASAMVAGRGILDSPVLGRSSELLLRCKGKLSPYSPGQGNESALKPSGKVAWIDTTCF